MAMIPNFKIFFTFSMFLFKFFFTNITTFYYYSFVNSFIFLQLMIFLARFLKDSQSFFMQSLLLFTSCFFSILLNDDIVEIEKPDGISLPAFAVDEFSGLFSHQSIFLNIQDLHK